MPPRGDHGRNAIPRSAQKSSSTLLVWLNFGENSFCTAASSPRPSTSTAISISSTLAFEIPISEISPSALKAAKVSITEA